MDPLKRSREARDAVLSTYLEPYTRGEVTDPDQAALDENLREESARYGIGLLVFLLFAFVAPLVFIFAHSHN